MTNDSLQYENLGIIKVGKEPLELTKPKLLLKAGSAMVLAQVTKGFVQLVLKTFKDGVSGQPALLLGCPHGENDFPRAKSETSLFRCTTFASCFQSITFVCYPPTMRL